MPHIAQVEFFHVGGKSSETLSDRFSACMELIEETLELHIQGIECPSKLKTVVRFYDRDNSLTKLVQKSQTLEKKEENLVCLMLKTTGILQTWHAWRHRRVTHHMRLLRNEMLEHAIERLRDALASGEIVAIETWERRFRELHKDERHETVERVTRAKSAWLFVFLDNDLFSDSNTLVGCIM